MMMLDSGTVRSRASSRSTGKRRIGQTLRKSSREASSSSRTTRGSNGVSFSYSAISTLWQNEDSGCMYSSRLMAGSLGDRGEAVQPAFRCSDERVGGFSTGQGDCRRLRPDASVCRVPTHHQGTRMNSASPEVLEVRLARIERSLRRARWGMLGLLLLVVALFLAWYGVGGIVQREIRVHRIYAVDDAGVVRVRIGQDPAGGHRMSRAAGVIVYDTTGLE